MEDINDAASDYFKGGFRGASTNRKLTGISVECQEEYFEEN